MTAVVKYLGGKRGSGFGLSVAAADVPFQTEALRLLSKPVGGVHPQAKRVSADALLRVDCNKPFEDFPRAVYGWKHVFDGEGEDNEEISESYLVVENFLRRTFHSLMFIPEISFDVRDISERWVSTTSRCVWISLRLACQRN